MTTVVRRAKDAALRGLKANLWKLPLDMLEQAVARAILHKPFARLFSTPCIAKREAVWDRVIETMGTSRNILFLEFGVHEGYSIRYFSERLTSSGSRFVGFDSFEGLPETWGRKHAGTFSTQGQLPDIKDERIQFVRGWFHRTLPSFGIDARQFDAVLVHLDADLYSSTSFVLSQLWGKLDSFHAVFDEFSNHETRALYNFSQSHPCEIEFLAHDGPVPMRVFCRIMRSA